MATSSYSNLFGTTGGGSELTSAGQLGSQQNPYSRQGSQAGISTMFGQQSRQRPADQQPTQTFAQLQKQGMARPAPAAPQGQPFARFGGSEQAMQARTGMLGQLQQQLAQPTRFDTQAFQQIRQAQAANLGAEYQAEQSRLNEELARRGLSASSVGGGRMGDLAGQQARALASLDAQLLQQAAQTQAQDRLAAMQAAGQFADLAGSQDLAQFEANRVAQAAEFAQGLQGAQFEQGQREFERGQALAAAQAQQAGGQSAMELELRRQLGLGELTGRVDGRQTLAAQQQAAQQRLQEAQLTGRLGEVQTLAGQQMGQQQLRDAAARAEALSQQTGLSYTVNASGAVVPQLDARGQQITTLAARQLGEQTLERQLRERLGEAELTGRLGTQQTLAAQQLEQQRAMQLAELTGTISVPGPGGKAMQVSTLAAQRLGQEGMALKMQQAAQLAQQTGQVYDIDAQGNVVPKTIGGQPVRTESALARLSQEELQRAELTGSIMRDGVSVPTLAAQRMTQDQVNALRDQALRQSQTTGIMYRVNAAGTGIEQDRDASGNPITTEQRRAQQAQEQTQARQLAAQQAEALSQQTGLAYKVGDDGQVVPDVDADGKQRTTVQAQQLKQQGDFQTRQLEQQRDLALAEMGGSVPVIDPATGRQQVDAQGNPMFRETVQARQVRQQYENQLAELRGYMEVPDPNNPGKTIKVDTMAQKQFDQNRLNALAAQAAERSQLTGFMYKVGANGDIVQDFGPDNKPITTAQAGQFAQSFGLQQQAADQQLAMQLAEIFSKSTDPNAGAALQPILQALMSRLPGYQAASGTTGGSATGGATGGTTGGTTTGSTGATGGTGGGGAMDSGTMAGGTAGGMGGVDQQALMDALARILTPNAF